MSEWVSERALSTCSGGGFCVERTTYTNQQACAGSRLPHQCAVQMSEGWCLHASTTASFVSATAERVARCTLAPPAPLPRVAIASNEHWDVLCLSAIVAHICLHRCAPVAHIVNLGISCLLFCCLPWHHSPPIHIQRHTTAHRQTDR